MSNKPERFLSYTIYIHAMTCENFTLYKYK